MDNSEGAVLLVEDDASIRRGLHATLSALRFVVGEASTGEEAHEMRWTEYSIAMLVFSLITLLVTYGIERVQYFLPLNPQHLANVPADLAFNTAVSFTTNTNWQSYVPEATMSYLTQMLTLAYHNFFSAAVGIALAVALIRGDRASRVSNTGELLGRYNPRLALDITSSLRHLCAAARLAGGGAELSPV